MHLDQSADVVSNAIVAEPKRRSSRGHRKWSPSVRMLVACISAGSAVGGILAHSAPTGSSTIDLVYRAVLAGAMAAITPRARRWSWILAGTVAAVCCSFPGMLFGFGSLCVGIWVVWRTKRNPVLGSVAGALAVQGLLRMEWPKTFGATAVVGTLTVVCVITSACRTMRRRTRTRIRWCVAGFLLIAGLAGAGAAITVISVKSDVEHGVHRASDGLEMVQAGDQARGGTLLRTADRSFAGAATTLSSWWMRPALAVPIIGQHIRATTTLVSDGRLLTSRASDVASEVDFKRLRRADGSIDLAAFSGFRTVLTRSAAAVTSTQRDIAKVSSGWLLPLLDDRIEEFSARLGKLAPGVESTSQAAKFLPALLGGSGQRRYFLMLLTPSETRDLGGHMGNWAELTVADGRFSVPHSGRTELLTSQSHERPTLHHPDLYPPSYQAARPALFPQNWGASPDLPTVAKGVADLYPQSGGSAIDGVAVIDPYGFAALLKLTGPITDPSGPTLTAANAAAFLLRDQYGAFPNDSARGDYLTRVVTATIQRLKTGGTTSPRDLVDALGPAVNAHQLRFLTFDPAEAAFLTRVGLNRPVRAPASGDQIAVLSTNKGPNKMDAYVQRAIDIAVEVDPDAGSVVEHVTVTLTNKGTAQSSREVIANSQGLADGTAIDAISLLSPLRLEGVTVNGSPAASGPQVEFGLNRFSVPIAVPSGTTSKIEFEVTGRLQHPSRYALSVLRQPLSSSDHVTVTVKGSDGVAWPGTFALTGADASPASTAPVSVVLTADLKLVFHAP